MEKPTQFKGDRKEYERWKKLLDMYLQAAREVLTNSEEKILFTYSLMQEGEAYHFVRYYKEQVRTNQAQWDWANFEQQMERRFLPANIAKNAFKELHLLKQEKMDANTFLVKLTNLLHRACITDEATMIDFLEHSTKTSIIERIYSSGNVPTMLEEY